MVVVRIVLAWYHKLLVNWLSCEHLIGLINEVRTSSTSGYPSHTVSMLLPYLEIAELIINRLQKAIRSLIHPVELLSSHQVWSCLQRPLNELSLVNCEG